MNTLKILDRTKQQRLDFLQSKIILLKQLQITEYDYNIKVQDFGERFVQKIWGDPVLQEAILTDTRLGFWDSFTYEWDNHNDNIVQDIWNNKLSLYTENYWQLKVEYFSENRRAINNITYNVQGNINHYYERKTQ